MIKYLMIIGDGMADRPVAALGGQTPLQAAHTPVFDLLAGQRLGRTVSIPKNQPAGTETAIPILLGYGTDVLTGRGPIEAAGAGIDLRDGQWAMRMNLVTFDENGRLADACPELDAAEIERAVSQLKSDHTFNNVLKKYEIVWHAQPSFRQLLIGGGTPPAPLPTPPHNVLGAELNKSLPNNTMIQNLMRSGREALRSRNTANGVWPWGCGAAPRYAPFIDRYGKTGACVTAVPMVSGLARLCGLTVVDVPGATGTLHTDWRAKAAACVKAFDTHDFVLLHIEAPDDCSHAKQLKDKIAAIEMLDAAAGVILDAMRGQHLRVCLVSDHYTLVETGEHTADSTPYCIWDSQLTNKTGSFAENICEPADGHAPIKELLGGHYE